MTRRTKTQRTTLDWPRRPSGGQLMPVGVQRDIVHCTAVVGQRVADLLAGVSRGAAVANLSASLARLLAEKGIRLNSAAPAPIWAPLIPRASNE